LILRIVRPEELRSQIRQVNIDKCQDTLFQELKRRGKYVNELIILPSGKIIIVEQAEQPTARDGAQPGHVHGRGRGDSDDGALHPRPGHRRQRIHRPTFARSTE